MSMKNPLTPGGIEPATFRFVAQHLNPCAAVPPPLVDISVDKYTIDTFYANRVLECRMDSYTSRHKPAVGCLEP